MYSVDCHSKLVKKEYESALTTSWNMIFSLTESVVSCKEQCNENFDPMALLMELAYFSHVNEASVDL